MFKYLRNINNSNHPSELVTFPFEHNSEGTLDIKPGMIFTLSAGNITMVFVTDSPKFLVVKVSKEDSTATCIRLCPGMVLEADIDTSLALDRVFDGLYSGISIPENSGGTHINGWSDEENIFQVIDSSNKNKRKATVLVI